MPPDYSPGVSSSWKGPSSLTHLGGRVFTTARDQRAGATFCPWSLRLGEGGAAGQEAETSRAGGTMGSLVWALLVGREGGGNRKGEQTL